MAFKSHKIFLFEARWRGTKKRFFIQARDSDAALSKAQKSPESRGAVDLILIREAAPSEVSWKETY